AAEALEGLSSRLDLPFTRETLAVRESFLKAAPFVGREHELAQLRTGLEALRAGKNSFWLVEGESGIGKSRLLDELRIEALVAGVRVQRGQAIEEGGLPFQLWRDITRSLILSATALSDLDASVLRDVVPDIGRILKRPVADIPPLNGGDHRKRLSFVLSSLLEQVGQPLLLLLEDLHWTMGSLGVLEDILQVFDQFPHLMIVGTYRSDEISNLQQSFPDAQVIGLGRLDRDAVSQLTQGMLGQIERQAEVQNFLETHSEGNVFFMIDAIQELAANKARLTDIGGFGLPADLLAPGMLASARRRLRRVSDRYQTILQYAAVIGREIDFALLQTIDPTFDADDWLDACANAAILAYDDDGRWRFAHDKLRTGILHDLSSDQAPHLHQQVAETIEKTYTDQLNVYAQSLVEHFAAAGDRQKEGLYALQAADAFYNVDFGKACLYYERALAYHAYESSDQPEHAHADLLRKLGQAYTELGDHQSAQTYLHEALAMFESLGDPVMVAATKNDLAEAAFIQNDLDLAERLSGEALTISEEEGSLVNQMFSLIKLQAAAAYRGDMDKSGIYGERAYVIARQAEVKPRELALVLNNYAVVLIRSKAWDKAEAVLQESLELRRGIGDVYGMAFTYYNWAWLEEDRGDSQAAIDCYLRSADLFKQCGSWQKYGNTLTLLGNLYMADGQLDLAEREFQKALKIAIRTGHPREISGVYRSLGMFSAEKGAYEAAFGYYFHSLNVLKKSIGDSGTFFTLLRHSEALLKQGDATSAAYWMAIACKHENFEYGNSNQIQTIDALIEAALPIEKIHEIQDKASKMSFSEGISQFLNEYAHYADKIKQ
ncbi:MAG: tetratricopeptide repeat protein, partial [Chloroflexota bacterium]